MTKANLLLKKAMMLILATGLMFFASCKKEKDEPKTGNMIFYTLINNTEFDEIEIFVDGKSRGKITLSHIERPDCGTASSINVISVKLPAGVHSWYAKQYKGGVYIDGWDERDETIVAGKCEFIKLTE